jgi:hypothetical protein
MTATDLLHKLAPFLLLQLLPLEPLDCRLVGRCSHGMMPYMNYLVRTK